MRAALVAVFIAAATAPALQAAPKAPAKPATKAAPKGVGMGAVARAEQVTGKKMTATQKARIVAAAKAREKTIDDARKTAYAKFWSSVAATAGTTSAKITPPKAKAKK